MGSEFRYLLGNVLGTQECPTLRLASRHFVLYLNLIKSMFNTCILTHTHTSIHLSCNMASFIPNPNHTSNHAHQANLTYIYHDNHLIINPSVHLSWRLIKLAYNLSWHLINLEYIYHGISYRSIIPSIHPIIHIITS